MRRRTFLAAAPVTALAAAHPDRSPHRVGTADVNRLDRLLAQVIAADDEGGGTEALEARAADLAQQALALQRAGAVSQRIRSMLYSIAASSTSSAMWAAIDGRRLTSAQSHLNHAVTLAGLSGDPSVQVRVWGHAGALYRQTGRHTDALAAADAARATSIIRRDALYASLTHARMAVHQAATGDTTAVLRSLGHAQDNLDRADRTEPRPAWTRFYDQAELELLSLIAHCELGRWPEAEAHAHRNLALLRPGMARNRALTLAYLANTQLRQGDVDAAVSTAQTVPPAACRGRTAHLLNAFTSHLTATAPTSPHTRAWTSHRKDARAR